MAGLIKGPRELWNALQKRGGLDLKYQMDMDQQFLLELAIGIGANGPSPRAISMAVANPALTTEQFVGALMSALGPFSRMMADLLELFERARARTTDASLEIEFDFRNAPKLRFDLKHFRDWMKVLETVRERTKVRRWTREQLWALRSEVYTGYDSPTPADDWTREYTRGRLTMPDVPEPSSGHAELDHYLRQAFGVWRTVMTATAGLTGTAGELRELAGGRELEPASTDWSPQLLYALHADYWGTLIRDLYALAISARLEPGRADAVASRLRDFFATVPSMTIEEDRLVESLLEFLNLPAWKKRNELYSAWVFTLIAEALEPNDLRIHHDGGRLSFSFGGSHLATAHGGGGDLHVWAEIRSPLPKKSLLSGRNAIQPDYTLVTDPITGVGSAVAVVEVKQYRSFDKRNFSHAVIDYATGRPRAEVFLASYGPAKDAFLKELPPAMASRIHLFGDLRPDDDMRRKQFRDRLREAVSRWFGAVPVSATRLAGAPSITLTWGPAPEDLDLHLLFTHDGAADEVCHRKRGALTEYPWAKLDLDIKDGFGPETITLAGTLPTLYRCVVAKYAGDRPLTASDATVVLAHGGTTIELHCPTEGNGLYWHVFDFDARTGRIEVVNRITGIMPEAPLDPRIAPSPSPSSPPSPR